MLLLGCAKSPLCLAPPPRPSFLLAYVFLSSSGFAVRAIAPARVCMSLLVACAVLPQKSESHCSFALVSLPLSRVRCLSFS